MEKLKVATVVGTRPELIRLSRVIASFESAFDHVLIHTSQNSDPTLNQIFLTELGLPEPKYHLNVDTSSIAKSIGETIIKVEEPLLQEKPDAMVVLGDTNSCLSSIVGRKLSIPVYHLEAGNRCFDLNVPEETNRRIVDHVSDFNLVYSEHARRNLLSEGLHPRRILKIGSPMHEVLRHYHDKILASDILQRLNLTPKEYFVVSAHRAENVDSKDRLKALLDCLIALYQEWKLPIYVSTHPRTAKKLTELDLTELPEEINFGSPLGFFDYNNLQINAKCCLSDSGTISEESSMLQIPAVTLRDSIERPEALDSGNIIMTGLNPQNVLSGVNQAIQNQNLNMPVDYQIMNTSEIVTRFIISTVNRHHQWDGIRK